MSTEIEAQIHGYVDPEPWVSGTNATLQRFANNCSCGCTRFEPRPEFLPAAGGKSE